MLSFIEQTLSLIPEQVEALSQTRMSCLIEKMRFMVEQVEGLRSTRMLCLIKQVLSFIEQVEAQGCTRMSCLIEKMPSLVEQVEALSSIRMYVAKDLRQPEPRATAVEQLAEVMRRFTGKPPTLDAEEDLGATSRYCTSSF